jgi:chemotaxis protein MotA
MADGGTKTSFDIATVAGLAIGFALIIAAIVLGGSPGAFIDIPSVLIVIGGTAAITAVCFALGEFLGAGKVLMRTIFHKSRNPADAALQILQLAEIARISTVCKARNIFGRDCRLSSMAHHPKKSKPSCART